jgi:hypothetical protein
METWTGKLLSKLKLKIMKKTENDFQIVSMVIPIMNGNYAKLLFLDGHIYKKLKEASESNKGKNKQIFAMYAESDISHNMNTRKTGCITKKQFDSIIKEIYNQKLQYGKNNKILKNVA